MTASEKGTSYPIMWFRSRAQDPLHAPRLLCLPLGRVKAEVGLEFCLQYLLCWWSSSLYLPCSSIGSTVLYSIWFIHDFYLLLNVFPCDACAYWLLQSHLFPPKASVRRRIVWVKKNSHCDWPVFSVELHALQVQWREPAAADFFLLYDFGF